MGREYALPHNGWLPRAHQMPLWRYLQNGGKRALAVWHRRAGKDEVALHHAAVSMIKRPGGYWHMLPEYAQGRKAIWDAVNPHTGKRRIDEAFPHELRAATKDNEMQIRLINNSTWQVVGSDRFDTQVGSSICGCTYSEWALANPSAWGYHRPMLEENDGWAVFITTPRGHNHAKSMFDHAARADGWFCEMLTVHDTNALTVEQQVEALTELQAIFGKDVGRAQWEQEYECSFTASILGAFYSLEMRDVRREGRIVNIEPLDGVPVNTSWDLGTRDDTSIWFWQAVGAQLYILDHYAASGVGVEHYRDMIRQREVERGWIHGTDYVPHDAKVLEWGTGRTRVETMSALGLHPMLVPQATVDDGINAVRRALPLCVFHPRTEDGGITALEQYRREWDDDKKAFKASAVHDWTSHPADSFRYLALAWKAAPRKVAKEPKLQGWFIPPPVEPRRGGIRL